MKRFPALRTLVILAVLLPNLAESVSQQANDPTGSSAAASAGPATIAGVAARAFESAHYAVIQLDGANEVPHDYRVLTVTDSGAVNFVKGDSHSPDPWESLVWSMGAIDGGAIGPMVQPTGNDYESTYYGKLNRGGYYLRTDQYSHNPDDWFAYHMEQRDFLRQYGTTTESEVKVPESQDYLQQVTAQQLANLAALPDQPIVMDSLVLLSGIYNYSGFWPLEDGSSIGPAQWSASTEMLYHYGNNTSLYVHHSNGSLGDFNRVEKWLHWSAPGVVPAPVPGAQTVDERMWPNATEVISTRVSGGMGENALLEVIRHPVNEWMDSQNLIWGFIDKTGTLKVNLKDLGYDVFGSAGGGIVVSRNGHMAQRLKSKVIMNQYPVQPTLELTAALDGAQGYGSYLDVNDVGDILLVNSEATGNRVADILVREFVDAEGHKEIGRRQFSDNTLPEGWTGLQITALANSMPLAKQRELEAENAYPPKSEDTPLPMLGGTAVKGGKRYPVLLLPVELRDMKDSADTGDDVTITPWDTATQTNPTDANIAWIEPHKSATDAAPRMPQLELKITGLPATMTIQAKIEVQYTRGNGARTARNQAEDRMRIPADGSFQMVTGDTWKIWETYSAETFFGGEATLTYKLMTGTTEALAAQTIRFRIGGKNPDSARARTFIQSLAECNATGSLWFAYAIARSESQDYNGGGSRYNQFLRLPQNPRDNGRPLWGNDGGARPGGYGMFQVTGNVQDSEVNIPRGQIWNWQTNAEAARVIIVDKRRSATNWMTLQSNATHANGIAIPFHTVGNVTFDGVKHTLLHACTIKAYNGASKPTSDTDDGTIAGFVLDPSYPTIGHYGYWHSGNSKWGLCRYNNLGFNYVARVCGEVQP